MTTQLQTILDALIYSTPIAEFDDMQSEQDASDKHNEAIAIVRGMMSVEPIGKLVVNPHSDAGIGIEFIIKNPEEVLSVDQLVYAAPVAPQAVPAGWKLVPVEPTEAMINASLDFSSWGIVRGQKVHIPIAYKAMLAAAPAVEGGV